MSDDIQIRTVTVELLRAGPAHNQLLSPLTQYLGVCDDAEAGIVTLPFEHAAFLRRMKSMRYVTQADSEGKTDRLPVLRELGGEMAKVLGSVPRLAGALNSDAGGPDTLVHLRLVLSASELASLPFEQSKIPISTNAFSEGWLSLQARVPVVITRRTRNVSEGGVPWPTQPRILFVAADPAEVPFELHKALLVDAVRPYLKPGQDQALRSDEGRREQFGELLTVLENASFNQVAEECATHRYTHIHILAHGAEDEATEERSYGLALRHPSGGTEVIAGERLATAFACLVGGAIHRPSVVVLATCDSANQAAVMAPGASIAHVLHQAGIPMVVASQYPLSKEGSVLVTRELYPGLLRGENPWILLHRIRTGLHGRVMAHSHDWASLVVYEALPAHLDEQLEDVQYHQGRRAINVAIDRIDRAVAEATRSGTMLEATLAKGLKDKVQRATEQLPRGGRFITECLGLRASSKKRLAEAEFNIARAASPKDQLNHVKRSLLFLDQALDDYKSAVDSILVSQAGQVVQRVASLHWVLVQQLCLSAVLGKATREGAWETARMSAEAYLERRELVEHAWARGSLIELWLIAAADPDASQRERQAAVREAHVHAFELSKLYHTPDAFPIESTRLQLNRYANWWSHDLIENVIHQQFPDYPSWKALGIVDAAKALIECLDGRSTLGRIASDVEDGPTAAAVQQVSTTAAKANAALAAKPPQDRLGGNAPTAPKRATRKTADKGDAVFTIDMLPADHGDCLWIEYGEGRSLQRVLIDCGTERTYHTHLQARIAALPAKQREFELFILSHIDDDHIGGALPLLTDEALGARFGDIWFNGWKHLRDEPERLGAVQGEVFSALLRKHRHPWNEWQNKAAIVVSSTQLPTHTLPGGLQLTLLSPDRDKLAPLRKKWEKDVTAKGLTPGQAPERLGKTVSTSTDIARLAATPFKSDTTPHNGSSIAVLAEFGGKRALLAADAHAPLLVESIGKLCAQRGEKKLRLDAFKLPHHASRNNLNEELLARLDCRNYLVSTSGARFNHPDREAIARVILHGGPQAQLWFNYRSELNAVWDDAALRRKHGYEAFYPEGELAGRRVRL